MRLETGCYALAKVINRGIAICAQGNSLPALFLIAIAQIVKMKASF